MTIARARDRAMARDPGVSTMEAALKMVAAGPKTRADLMRRLVARGCDDRDAGECLERLEQMGYVDDESFAERWVEEHQQRAPSGKMALRQRLLHKGVPREIVERVLERSVAEGPAAARAARTYLGKDGRLKRREEESPSRLASHLRSRGFEYDIIAKTVRDFLKTEPE